MARDADTTCAECGSDQITVGKRGSTPNGVPAVRLECDACGHEWGDILL